MKMSPKVPSTLGKILYGAVFIAALPVLLVVWARTTEKSFSLPGIESMPAGLIIGGLGAGIMAAGMGAIYFYGHGLPMNAYPPARFVSEGVYRFLPHPIYTGFSTLCFGVSIAAGSSSGLWLVSPAVVIGCVALVQGYEKRATREHFGEVNAKPLIHFPPDKETRPTIADRISAYLLGIVPWLIFIQITRVIDGSGSTVSPLPFESKIPVYQWAEPIYLSQFLMILLVPLAVRKTRDLRTFLIYGLAATALSGLLFVAFPYSFPLRPFVPDGLLGKLLVWDQTFSGRALFSLSSQVAWTLIAATFCSRTGGLRRIVIVVWASLAIASGLLTGAQTVSSILVGIALFFIAVNISGVWELVRSATERIANSWTEWRFGPLRVINHGIYATAGAFVSLSLVGTLVGPALVPHMIMITLLAIVISGLSAQWIEGSPMLLRPYGWYGGVAGAFLGMIIVWVIGGDVWLLAAAFCVGAPWIQAAGRLRCLVQGCCHGREAAPEIGIRYVHPMSRVCRLANLSGVSVHPTQLYSILCNIVVAIIAGRLWLSGASLTLIVGIYFILTGMGRFVEESYRGEPQTPKFAGLRLYQFLAMLTVIGGIIVTMAGNLGYAPEPRFNWESIAASASFGIFVLLAFGVDFPNSNRRFARLA